jgi:hypothetical protein
MPWTFSPRALFRGSTLDRRQGELDHAVAAGRQDAFEAEPQRPHGSKPVGCRSTARRPMPVRPPCGSRSRPRPRAVPRRQSSSCCGSRPGGGARPALLERPPAHPPRRFWGKPLSHRHLLGPSAGGPSPQPIGIGKCNANDTICQFHYRNRPMHGALGRTRVFPICARSGEEASKFDLHTRPLSVRA